MASHTDKRPQPVVVRAQITAVISVLTSLLVTLGVFPATIGKQIDGLAETVIAAVFAVLAGVPVLIHAYQARKVVTPLSAPQDAAGNPLRAAEPDTAVSDGSDALAAAQAVFPAEPVAPVAVKDAYGNLIRSN